MLPPHARPSPYRRSAPLAPQPAAACQPSIAWPAFHPSPSCQAPPCLPPGPAARRQGDCEQHVWDARGGAGGRLPVCPVLLVPGQPGQHGGGKGGGGGCVGPPGGTPQWACPGEAVASVRHRRWPACSSATPPVKPAEPLAWCPCLCLPAPRSPSSDPRLTAAPPPPPPLAPTGHQAHLPGHRRLCRRRDQPGGLPV